MSKGRILIVDDTAVYRQMLGDALAEAGYEVIYAANGMEAIQIVKEEMPTISLVLLDLLMPKMLGFDVLQNIRHMEGGWDLSVMVITGLFKSMNDIKRVRDLGAVGFIDKAQSMEEIVARVDNYLHPDWEEKVEHQIPANLLVTYKAGAKPFSAYTHTIGSTGMFLRTDSVALRGAEVTARFRLEEEGETVEVKGKVNCVISGSESAGGKKMPRGFGMDFTEVSPGNQAKIDNWVKEQSAELGMAPPESPQEK